MHKLYKNSVGYNWKTYMTASNNKFRLSDYPLLEDIVYVLGGMVLAVLFYNVLGFALGTDDPVVTVVSDSMLPTLHRGDMLVLKGVPFEDLEAGGEHGKGDIIVYICEGDNCPGRKLIVHRLYQKNDDGTFVTWGDNNKVPDPWTGHEGWIKGKEIARVPYLGYPRLVLSKIFGI